MVMYSVKKKILETKPKKKSNMSYGGHPQKKWLQEYFWSGHMGNFIAVRCTSLSCVQSSTSSINQTGQFMFTGGYGWNYVEGRGGL